MGLIYDTVLSAFKAEELNYELNDDKDVFSMIFTTDNGNVTVKLLVGEEDAYFGVVGYLPATIPVKYVDRVYAIINDINKNSVLPFWVFDPESGELSLRCGNSVPDGHINERMVVELVYGIVELIDGQYESIMKEIYK
ncbi:MAG: YbjN domain-containing protein [Rikenellaceae bacterium]|nr:YbjN domain-containing protein [Rikenellaceae bacterium]